MGNGRASDITGGVFQSNGLGETPGITQFHSMRQPDPDTLNWAFFWLFG